MTTNHEGEKLKRYEELYAKDAREGLTLKELEEHIALFSDLNRDDAQPKESRSTTMQQDQSKVANLMRQIQAEYAVGNRLLGKLPADIQAWSVNRRVDNMLHYQEELIALVGTETASTLLASVGL